MFQQAIGLMSTFKKSEYHEINEHVRYTSDTQRQAYELGNRVNLRPRSNSVPARTGDAVVQQGRTIIIPQEAAVTGFVYELPPSIASKLSM